ncbi:MAG: signal peptidase II [Streptococcaceae bacterium]|jgi:signal peptidase II|nr:signal peptidase II [Streptococcaceae bacterium]
MFLPYLLIIVLVAIDQLIKYQIVANITLGERIDFIPNILSLTYLKNNGAAWSILEGQMWFFIVITLAALAVAFYFLIKRPKTHQLMTISIVIITAGIIGNFIDRIRLGYVVDMFQLDFINFPIFNFADACLVIGVLLLCVYLFKFDTENMKEK